MTAAAEAELVTHLADGLERQAVSHIEVVARVREALAWSIAAERSPATLLDEQNRAVGRTTISEATQADLCYFVAVANEVLAVEFDDDAATSRAHELFALLLLNNLAPVMVASGRPGHRHVFCRVPPTRKRELIDLAGLTSSEVRTAIRPPLSAHRMGQQVQLIAPRDPLEALDRLRGSARVRALGRKARAAIIQGTTETAVSGSEVIFSVAMGAANAGWSREDFLLVLASPTTPVHRLLVSRIRHRGIRHTAEWLRDEVWPGANAIVAASPPRAQAVAASHAALVHWALTTEWLGRTAATDRAVYLALLRKRVSSNCSLFDVSQRELCLLAGISGLSTVSNALTRLVDRGVVHRHPRSKSNDRTLHRLSDSWELRDPPDCDWTVLDPHMLTNLEALGDDLFRNRDGLGKALQHLYLVLINFPGGTVEDLAQITKRCSTWVRQGLRTLATCGLAEVDDAGRWSRGVVTTEVAAKELGAAGRGLRQLEQFDRERDSFDRPLDRWSGDNELGTHPQGGV